jgi:hypothetical protein
MRNQTPQHNSCHLPRKKASSWDDRDCARRKRVQI